MEKTMSRLWCEVKSGLPGNRKRVKPKRAIPKRQIASNIKKIRYQIIRSESILAGLRKNRAKLVSDWAASHPRYQRPRTSEQAKQQKLEYTEHVGLLRALDM
ncbi:MAG: hypothetical protein HY392_03855 [Candidatus Diapherotrites archaeon]|nr:hypothetical protein [Candidatus Diapherotrites archaeon]